MLYVHSKARGSMTYPKQDALFTTVWETQLNGNYARHQCAVWRTSLVVMMNPLHCKWLDSVNTSLVTMTVHLRADKELKCVSMWGVIPSTLSNSMISDLRWLQRD